MDPLAERLACACVAGYAQRRYDKLAAFLAARLDRPVELVFSEALQPSRDATFDLIIGELSVVRHDARLARLSVRTLAMLTDGQGSISLTGLFVVRDGDPARSIADLKGRRILFGPEDHIEKQAAALATLEAFNVPASGELETRPACNIAAIAVVEDEADAAVISSYAMPLLEGCGTLAKGELRVIGRTDPVPFIAVYATDRVGTDAEARIQKALAAVRVQRDLLQAMESRYGFVPLAAMGPGQAWSDWRGPGRRAQSRDVPARLPERRQLLWSHTLTGPGMSGLAVAQGCVIVADKSVDDKSDIFRCLGADTGDELWKLTYPAPGDMDFTNSPRANPVIAGNLVYLLGAFGHLHCVELQSGQVKWRRHLQRDFEAKLPTWGFSSTPLIVDDKLIVNPGAAEASIAALDRDTGRILWAAPGGPPGYASFILATLGGIRQIVGYDVASLGGWDTNTGQRLWTLVPEIEGDFNVTTPIVVDGKLLVSTENNGTRLFAFDREGRIEPGPIASSDALRPDTATPVVVNNLLFGSSGSLVCLNLANRLSTSWQADDDLFSYHNTFIAGPGQVLVVTQSGVACLFRATETRLETISRLPLFDDLPDTERDVWSHPAIVGGRLYVRNLLGVYCFLLVVPG